VAPGKGSAWRPPDQISPVPDGERLTVTTGDQLAITLTIAEQMLEATNEIRRHNQVIEVWLAGLAIVITLWLIGLFAFIYEAHLRSAPFLTVVASLASGGAAIGVFLITRNLLRARRQRYSSEYRLQAARALAKLVDDVLFDVSQREGWSQVQIQTMQIRLSVFPLVERDSHGGLFSSDDT
jgi:hypothetical protein